MRRLAIVWMLVAVVLIGCGGEDKPTATPANGSCLALDGTCTVTTQVACTGTWTEAGVCPPPDTPVCQVTPSALVFDTVAVGQTKDLAFRIKNTGGGTLTGSVTEICESYSIQSGGGSYSLAANQEKTVTVRFAPTSSGAQACTVDLGSVACGAVSCTGTSAEPARVYRGTFILSWQWQRGGGTESATASGTVEFGNPIDITQLYPEYAPGTAFSVTSTSSPAQFSNWHAEEANGTTCTAGPATANVSWGWLYIRTSPNEHAIELSVNGSALATCQPPVGPPSSYERGLGAFFGGTGCAPKFVPSGPDSATLEGTATWTCTNVAGTTTATLTWNLTGY